MIAPKGFFALFKSSKRKNNKKALKDEAENSVKQIPTKESFETQTTTPDDPRLSNLGTSIVRVDSLLGSPPKTKMTRNLHDLLENNRQWASQKRQYDPDYFVRLSSVQQQPHYLWIGCSDSRVPANQIVNMPPGEIFVHRNVANLVGDDDKNAMAVIQYAVETLKVKHIIVCGHTCCGGVRACFGPKLTNPLEDWLTPLRSLREKHAAQLEALPDEEARWRFLCEENVRQQVAVLEKLPIVRKAWENKQPLALHGWIYSMDEGLLRDLDVATDNGFFVPSDTPSPSRQPSIDEADQTSKNN